jgi:hypothetical protein
MISLAIGIAIFDEHTRLAHLEADTPLNAAFGTAGHSLSRLPTIFFTTLCFGGLPIKIQLNP